MNDLRQLVFERTEACEHLLPLACTLSVSCYQPVEIQQFIAKSVQNLFQSFAFAGMDLRSLDGITMAEDCGAAAKALRAVPAEATALDAGEQPGTFEMGCTVPIWRDNELRFHVVVRAGIGLGMLAADKIVQSAAYACYAHEAAHVEHEAHLYRTFPALYGDAVPCGNRSRQIFLKSVDVWSEYAACRSSAGFRPEAAEEFEHVFCRALEDSFSACERYITVYRNDGNADQLSMDVQQLLGDVFLCAGYFLGHLEALGLDSGRPASSASLSLAQNPKAADLIYRLRQVLEELWKTKYAWESVEVFSPIYELIGAMMALHGLVLKKTGEEWQIAVRP